MSLPRELLDELLSRSMDGELSQDEQTRLDQLLSDDATLRNELLQMRQQSATLRDALTAAPPLGEDFAERVVSSALSEAERADVAENHPLRLAAANTSTLTKPTGRARRRWGAKQPALWSGLLVLAASIALATLFLSPPAENQDPGRTDLAANIVPEELIPEELVPDEGTSDTAARREVASAELAPSPAVDPASVAAAPASVEPSTPAPDVEQVVDAGTPNAITPDALNPDALNPDALLPTGGGDAPAGLAAIRAVLVYEVHLTARGREQGVINRAFRESEIRVGNRRQIDDALVSHLAAGGIIGNAAKDDPQIGEGVELMFLEGSGRRLEQLMMKLLAARGEVSRVGFNMLLDPPVFAALDQLRVPDPTEIQSLPESDGSADTVALALAPRDAANPAAGGPAAGGGRFVAGTRDFLPLDASALASVTEMTSLSDDSQPDITSHILLIIRNE